MQVNGFNNIVTSFYAKVSKAFLLSNAPFITACANLRQFESRIFYFYSHILFLFYPLKSGISRSKARKVLCWKAQNDGLFFLFANRPILCVLSAREIIFLADWRERIDVDIENNFLEFLSAIRYWFFISFLPFRIYSVILLSHLLCDNI